MATLFRNPPGPDACRFGTWVKLSTLETLEMLAMAGFDFVVIDMEHAPLTLEQTYRSIVAAQGFGMSALVRLPDSGGSNVQRILDSGADGVLVPRVRTADEARDLVEGLTFSPQGSRGLGITSRAGKWGLDTVAEYVKRGNEDVFRCVQLEDQAALRDCERILDVPGVSGVFVGPGDLALSSGIPASHPDNASLISNLLESAHTRGLPCGTAVGDASGAREARARGFDFVMVSNDATLFGKAAVELLRGVKS